MYEILKVINETTRIGCKDDRLFLLKSLSAKEAEIYEKLRGLPCKNIARVLDVIPYGDGFCAVCEYVSGQTLEQVVRLSGCMSEEQACEVVAQICDGLEAVHALGIVHRDLSPNNILLTYDGTVKIVDFGISRLTKPGAGSDTEILGTPGYAAPEQYGFNQTDHRADIYAVGALLNFLVTGCLPNEKRATGKLGRIVDKCVRMDETKRYATVRHLRSDLRSELRSELRSDPAGKGETEAVGRFRHFLRKVPGFRQGILYREILASIYYITLFLVFLSVFFPGGTMDRETKAAAMMMFGLPLIPLCLFSDVGSWTEKWSFTKGLEKKKLRGIQLLFSVIGLLIFFYFDFLLFTFFF